jgi:tripartite-type tricarboxylate transporter receptor subunit TctC
VDFEPYIAAAQHLLRAIAGACLFSLCLVVPASAASFPQKPVRLVVPYRAGGSSDIVARLLSLRLADTWGRAVTVENVPGTASVYGTREVANAVPDGHTLLVGNAVLAINEALLRKLPYHALRDFAPLSLTARQHLALVVNADGGFQSAAQITNAARAAPAAVSFGSAGQGAVGHLAGELFKVAAGVNLVHVAYSGSRQAIRELIANHVSCAIIALPAAMPQVQAGKLRVLGVTGNHRAAALPNVPTIAESMPGYEVDNWVGILAPYGAKATLVRKINADLNAVINNPDFKALLASLGYEAAGSTPGEFQGRLAADIERYSRVVAAAGILDR